MASLVTQFTCVIPAGTPISAPVTIEMPAGTYTVLSIRWRVPPGPKGQMGFYLSSNGTPTIPAAVANNPQWIVTDNDSDEIPTTDYPNSGQWELVGYNVGHYPHSVYVTFQLEPVQPSANTVAAPLDTSAMGL